MSGPNTPSKTSLHHTVDTRKQIDLLHDFGEINNKTSKQGRHGLPRAHTSSAQSHRLYGAFGNLLRPIQCSIFPGTRVSNDTKNNQKREMMIKGCWLRPPPRSGANCEAQMLQTPAPPSRRALLQSALGASRVHHRGLHACEKALDTLVIRRAVTALPSIGVGR